MPFDSSGKLKPEGPGPYPVDFLKAVDLAKFPQWTRDRANAWTTENFRALVFRWLKDFLHSRPRIIVWDIEERAMGARTSLRLPDDQHYLRIGLTQYLGRGPKKIRVETAIPFPTRFRTDAEQVRKLLDLAGQTLDKLLG